jgi:hypothetical protein
MEEPLTMGPPSRDPIMTAASVEGSPAVRLRAHHELLATHIPPELELRDPGSGVWARHHVSRGTRYGPFVGKLTPEPIDPRYAWEVSLCSTFRVGLGQSRRDKNYGYKDSGRVPWFKPPRITRFRAFPPEYVRVFPSSHFAISNILL